MNKDQFEEIIHGNHSYGINVSSLMNQNDRTLVYGYNCDRDTYHLYLKDGKFHSIWYKTEYKDKIKKEIILSEYVGVDIDPYKCIPNKRVYPESCDFEFSKLLKEHGQELPYTRFNEERAEKLKYMKFHGDVLDREHIGNIILRLKEKFPNFGYLNGELGEYSQASLFQNGYAIFVNGIKESEVRDFMEYVEEMNLEYYSDEMDIPSVVLLEVIKDLTDGEEK